MTIGVVIVTHNSQEHIRGCVESLIRENIEHIVVVDSASTDDTLHQVAMFNVRTISLSENKGFGHAANTGAQKMNTDYVLFINPDARVETGALQRVQELLRMVRDIGVVGLSLQDSHGKQEAECFGKEPSLMRLVLRKFQREVILEDPFETDWVSGGAIVIHKKLFSQIGGFDKGFFLYWEDIDLCRRVRQAGKSVWLYPSARAIHIRGASQGNQKLKTRIYDTSADRYYKKHYPTHIWLIQRVLRKLYRTVRPLAL